MFGSIYLFFSFSASEIMFILFVALILFGGEKFPEIARGLGKGIREFKDMSDGVKREITQQINNYDVIAPRENTPVNQTPTQPIADIPQPSVPPTYHEPAQPVQPTAPIVNEVAEVTKKPDFTPPPNTISHQSY